MKWWPFQRNKDGCNEALAAKIQAELDYKKAEAQHKRVSKQAGKLQQKHDENHWSEAIRVAFGGGKP